MNKQSRRRALTLTLAPALVLAATAAFGAAPIGPVYPLPGGPGTGHGGSTCLAASSAEAAMGKTALLDLGMRLGEGTGAAMAAGLVKAAAEIHTGMATFTQAGVSVKAIVGALSGMMRKR